MVVRLHLQLWLALLPFILAKRTQATTFKWELIQSVLQHLNNSADQFDAWTGQMTENLSVEQQQRLAWNIRFLDKCKTERELRQLQQHLRPSSIRPNTLKLYLWMSFYWQLQRSKLLQNDHQLLAQFVLTLRQLMQQGEVWNNNNQLQNMLQSLPHYLIDLVKSRWICLKHEQTQLYALPGYALQLGANSECNMWQVELVQSTELLQLVNACELREIWFVNILEGNNNLKTFTLHNTTGNNSSIYCIRNGSGYLVQVDTETGQQEKDCQWQLNDCTHLPQFLSIYNNEHKTINIEQ